MRKAINEAHELSKSKRNRTTCTSQIALVTIVVSIVFLQVLFVYFADNFIMNVIDGTYLLQKKVDSSSSAVVANALQNNSNGWSRLPRMNFFTDQQNRVDTFPLTTKEKLPQWILDYITFHNEMRRKFPGKLLFTHPNAPKLLVRICLGLCGGLNDRLGQLPLDLYLANQTNRVYLINWQRPRALENFLLPNEIDWSIPTDVPGWGFHEMKVTRGQTKFFDGMPEDTPGTMQDFWTTQLDHAIQRANTGEFKDKKILIHRVLGHLDEDKLEKRLKALGEVDMIHNTLSYGRIFRTFFKPSPGVQQFLTQVQNELNLIPGQYTGVHCRVRHPKARAFGKVVHGKNEDYPADKTGLPFVGEDKDFAVGTATHAINCARTLGRREHESMYFFSDSNDLVKYMTHDLKDTNFLTKNATLVNNAIDQAAIRAVSPVKLVARDMSEENPHIDKQKGRDPPAYYPAFVDLYLAMGARCLTYGIGYYAVFASKLSGIDCKLLYTQETWGGSDIKLDRTPKCTEETYRSLL